MTLTFATNNAHKLEEARAIIGGRAEIRSMAQAGCHDDIPETADTLEGNARLKARCVAEHCRCDCFADDTGLEVEALGGAPGVYSARYAGPGHDSEANVAKLLRALKGQSNRKARFRTVIALWRNGEMQTMEGIVNGRIADAPRGEGGFGYDPVFIPDEGGGLTFAEMSAEAKNAISHRKRALSRLLEII